MLETQHVPIVKDGVRFENRLDAGKEYDGIPQATALDLIELKFAESAEPAPAVVLPAKEKKQGPGPKENASLPGAPLNK